MSRRKLKPPEHAQGYPPELREALAVPWKHHEDGLLVEPDAWSKYMHGIAARRRAGIKPTGVVGAANIKAGARLS